MPPVIPPSHPDRITSGNAAPITNEAVAQQRLALTLIRLLVSIWPEGRGVVEHRQQQVGEQDRLRYHGTENARVRRWNSSSRTTDTTGLTVLRD
jgi:hypothetical protein